MKILIEESVLRQALNELCTQRDAHYGRDYPTELRESITALRSALDAAEGVEDQLATVTKERDELRSAAQNLIDVKGRYHTEQAYKRLNATLAKVGADTTGETK